MFRRAILAIFLALLAFTSPASAQPRHVVPYGYNVQPLDRILPGIRNGRPGRFYDAEGPFADPMGGWHYRLKWLTPDGRIQWLDTDARTVNVTLYHDAQHPSALFVPIAVAAPKKPSQH